VQAREEEEVQRERRRRRRERRRREEEGAGGGHFSSMLLILFLPLLMLSLLHFSLSAPTLPSTDGSHVQPNNIMTVEKDPNRWFVTGSAPPAPPVFGLME